VSKDYYFRARIFFVPILFAWHFFGDYQVPSSKQTQLTQGHPTKDQIVFWSVRRSNMMYVELWWDGIWKLLAYFRKKSRTLNSFLSLKQLKARDANSIEKKKKKLRKICFRCREQLHSFNFCGCTYLVGCVLLSPLLANQLAPLSLLDNVEKTRLYLTSPLNRFKVPRLKHTKGWKRIRIFGLLAVQIVGEVFSVFRTKVRFTFKITC